MAKARSNARQIASPCRGMRRTFAERLQEILESLHSTLRAMTPPQRERSLGNLFSQPQRLRLEMYMQGLVSSKPKAEAEATPKMPRQTSSRGLLPKSRTMRTTVTTRAEVPALVVNPQKNGRYFRAQVAFRGLRLVSRSLRSMESILPFCKCLSQVKERLEAQVAEGPIKDFAEAFIQVLRATLKTCDISADDAGIRLYISFRPGGSAPLTSRAYDAANEADLRRGLCAWERIRGDDWKVFLEDAACTRQLKRTRAILEESARRKQQLLAKHMQSTRRHAEKECRKAQQELRRRLRKPRSQPLLSRPERAVRRLLRSWSTLETQHAQRKGQTPQTPPRAIRG